MRTLSRMHADKLETKRGLNGIYPFPKFIANKLPYITISNIFSPNYMYMSQTCYINLPNFGFLIHLDSLQNSDFLNFKTLKSQKYCNINFELGGCKTL